MLELNRILLLVVLFVGCKNGENIQPFSPNEPVVIDGRFDFETHDAFLNYINSIQDIRDEDLDEKLSKHVDFISLRPLFDETHTDKIIEWATAKKERMEIQRKRISTSGRLSGDPCIMQRISESIDDIDSEDELIKDPSFAALLNNKREISVAGKVYKYTYEGTYITDNDNMGAVYNYIENTSYSNIAQLPLGTNDIGDGVTLLKIKPIDDCGGGSTGVGTGGGGSDDESLSCIDDPNCDPSEFLPLCANIKTNWLPDFIGARTKCTNYFNDKSRIKTVAWDQDYGLWTTMGVKTISQKKVLGIWWRSKIHELELGYNYIYIEYPVIPFKWPSAAYNSYYNFNDKLYNQNGVYISQSDDHPISIFDNWPIKDVDYLIMEIYLKTPWPFDDIDENIKGSDINDFVKEQMANGIKSLGNYFGPKPSSSMTVSLDDMGNDLAKPHFIYADIKYHKNDRNHIVKVLDLTTGTIGFTHTFGEKLKEGDPSYAVAKKSFSAVKMDFYGMGKDYSGPWVGSRVEFESK